MPLSRRNFVIGTVSAALFTAGSYVAWRYGFGASPAAPEPEPDLTQIVEAEINFPSATWAELYPKKIALSDKADFLISYNGKNGYVEMDSGVILEGRRTEIKIPLSANLFAIFGGSSMLRYLSEVPHSKQRSAANISYKASLSDITLEFGPGDEIKDSYTYQIRTDSTRKFYSGTATAENLSSGGKRFVIPLPSTAKNEIMAAELIFSDEYPKPGVTCVIVPDKLI